jgi:two-component SAPR family response regulator
MIDYMFRWRLGPKIISTRDIWRKGEKLIRKGKTEDAELTLQQAAQSTSPLDCHYAYVKLVRLYQKMIRDGHERLQELTDVCCKDIALFPEFYEAWMVEYHNNIPTPYFPSFSVLAHIYEEQGKTEEAISLCELALGYELRETVGEDYPVTLERLYQKRLKEN